MNWVSEYLDKFLQFQQAMVEKLKSKEHVVGLMFAGSSADTTRADQYSDQDFFLVVDDGHGEAFRQDLSWLPNSEDIVIAPRETDHGLKVVYQNGDLLEFAVFENQDLDQPWLAVGTDYKVVLENKNISERLAVAAKRSLPKPENRQINYELFLSLILIGVGRARRGELIAAEQHIKSYAMNFALRLIRQSRPVGSPRLDTLNSYRRFEQDYPVQGKTIADLMLQPTEASARQLCEVVIAEIAASDKELAQYRVVANRLGWN
ncbi:MAG: hypothetical protein RL068_274 [Actinomycetota bacterium]